MHVFGGERLSSSWTLERPRVETAPEEFHVLGLNGSSVVVNYVSAAMYRVPYMHRRVGNSRAKSRAETCSYVVSRAMKEV